MSKYNEIMEHIELTEEMRERIIANIEAEQRRKRIRITTGIFTAAAACVAVVAGLTVLNGREPLPQQTATTTTTVTTATAATTETQPPAVSEPDAVSTAEDSSLDAEGFFAPVEYAGAKELSEAFGIEMHDVEMPFEVTESTYFLIFGNIAEISYYGADGEVCYLRTGKTEEDISGDYNEYDTEAEREVNGIKLTLKGFSEQSEKYNLCYWVQDGHFRSVNTESGMSETEMLGIAEKMMLTSDSR